MYSMFPLNFFAADIFLLYVFYIPFSITLVVLNIFKGFMSMDIDYRIYKDYVGI